MLGRAQKKGLIEIGTVDMRQFGAGPHAQVDDRPFGGGPGMVLMPEPVVSAVRSCRSESATLIHLSPQGRPLTAEMCESLAKKRHLILLCGHYEGIDQRALDVLEGEMPYEEISIGDYVVTSGAPAAIVVVDSVSRFVPGVIGNDEAVARDSFAEGVFDTPHYTRPRLFEGREVPEVLLGGNHSEIEAWRSARAREKTERVRPDLCEGVGK